MSSWWLRTNGRTFAEMTPAANSAPAAEVPPEFARLTLSGDGVRSARVPIENLVEFTRYRALVLASARGLWLEDHPDQVLPDDFEASFNLEVPPFLPGSATAVLEQPSRSVHDGYFEKGQDFLHLGLDSVIADDRSVLDADFFNVLDFRDFGSSLGEAQTLRIGPTANVRAPVDVTRAVWRERFKPTYERLVREANTRVTRSGSVAGRLVMLNPEDRSYSIQTLHHGLVNGKYSDARRTDDLRRVLDSNDRAPVVRFDGSLRFNRDKLVRILDVKSVEALEVEGAPWSRRIVELATYESGWLGDQAGQSISFLALDAAKAILSGVQNEKLKSPGIFPLEDGGVQLEWSSPQQVTNIEIDQDGAMELFSLHMADHRKIENETTSVSDAIQFVRGELE